MFDDVLLFGFVVCFLRVLSLWWEKCKKCFMIGGGEGGKEGMMEDVEEVIVVVLFLMFVFCFI